MSDLDYIINKRTETAKSIRGLKTLEEVALEFHILDDSDPMLYFMYKMVNKNELYEYEIEEINKTIDVLKTNQKRINEYNLSVITNDYASSHIF